MPPPAALVVLLLAIGTLFLFIQLEVLAIAFDKLGLSREQAAILLLTSLAGSLVNVPLFRIRGIPPEEVRYPPELAARLEFMPPYKGITVIAVNVGGCIVPVAFSSYLLVHAHLPLLQVLFAVAAVAAVSYAMARPMPGVGMGMPVFIAPLAAALAGVTLGGDEAALTAYVSGTVGVLIGADIARINDIRQLGAPVASIGGAGTFDGIFFTGIIAVLLA